MRLRSLMFGLAILAASAGPVRADDVTSFVEATMAGGIVSGPGFGRDPNVGLALSLGPTFSRLQANGGWTRLHKDTTPGGYQLSGNLGAQVFVTHNVFVMGGISRNFSDQTIWTKRVHYAYGGAGLRWSRKRHPELGIRQELSEISVTYFRETFSTYANRAEVYRASYAYEHRLGTGSVSARLAASIGLMYYDEHPYPGAVRRSGLESKFGIGLSYRPFWR
ncbi:MAG TPA: hypothetical protein VJ553_03610 [Candidatus Paceibacterota bacterium]|nr:hypothetical protein [Candidatus Paceibacterota bacterium]